MRVVFLFRLTQINFIVFLEQPGDWFKNHLGYMLSPRPLHQRIILLFLGSQLLQHNF